jgi:hypothetical protein
MNNCGRVTKTLGDRTDGNTLGKCGIPCARLAYGKRQYFFLTYNYIPLTPSLFVPFEFIASALCRYGVCFF